MYDFVLNYEYFVGWFGIKIWTIGSNRVFDRKTGTGTGTDTGITYTVRFSVLQIPHFRFRFQTGFEPNFSGNYPGPARKFKTIENDFIYENIWILIHIIRNIFLVHIWIDIAKTQMFYISPKIIIFGDFS